MIRTPTVDAWRPYLRVLAETGVDVASVGAWIAVAELPPAGRRLARSALTVANVMVAIPEARSAKAEPPIPDVGWRLPYVDTGITLPDEEDSDVDPSARWRAVAVAAVGAAFLVAASAGAAVAVNQLERRWLARLVEHGHPRPHRALGLRMAGLYAVMVLPVRLLAVRRDAKASPGDASNGTTDSG